MSRSRFAIFDPSLPFLLLSDFDGGQCNEYFEEEDRVFDGISGNGGNGGRNRFVHKGDPFASVPLRASVMRVPPQAQSRLPAPVPTPHI